jgi:hypothetical protein
MMGTMPRRKQVLPRRGRMRWVLMVAALGLGCGLGANAQAGGDPGQDGQGPAVAMGSGRMVRGTVTAVAGGKVTLKTENGDVFQVAFTANTRVMKGRDQAKVADVHVGDGIGAMGEIDPATKTVHALFVSVVDAEQVKKLRESLGKTWITGKVTAIDDLKLTILRGDKVTQVIVVDEDTSFKRGGRGMQTMLQGDGAVAMPPRGDRAGGGAGAGNAGGESITLADIKVGDNVAGQGSVKNGVFVPTQLSVADPTQQRRRRQPGDGVPAATPNGASPNGAGSNTAAGPSQ